MTASARNSRQKYELKHRLTGAAIIVVVAVLVIPLLLKEPNIEASIDSQITSTNDEQSFKSKIEPLNLGNIKMSRKADEPDKADQSNKANNSNKNEAKPALLKSDTDSIADNQLNKSSKGSDSEIQFSESKNKNKEAKQQKSAVVLTKAEQPKANDVNSEEPTQAKSGWSVRVGTFSKTENVESVSNLLNNSGFNARLTKVQTTLGEATRVWLGPYAKKETAEKVSIRLKSLTGEKGYVTKHAS